MSDEQMTRELHAFFGRVTAAAKHGKVLVAYDYRADLDLLHYALDGFEATETPTRPVFHTFDLRLLGITYNQAVEDRFEAEATVRARRHTAFTDAWVNRDA